MRTHLTSWLAAAGIVLAAAVVPAQRADRPATPALSPDDQLEIRQLVSRYANALDTGADNGAAYADLFADDGEFVGGRGTTRGREALAALGRQGFVEGRKPANGVAHFIMNHVVTAAPGGATGKQYMVLVNIGENGRPGGQFSSVGGHYDDQYVKTPKGWRFKRRQFIASSAARPGGEPQPLASPAPGAASRGAASSATPSSSPLTAQDYLDIRALAAQYSYGLDTGADNGWLYANVFTEDGEFHGPPAVPGGKPFDAKGRAQLRTFAVPGNGPDYVRHFTSNHAIEASPEGARGKLYLLVLDIARDGAPTSVNMGGHYEDVYVRTADGWRIKTRRFFRSKSAQTVQAEGAAAGR
jgi:uncharacterized protein (TIGR02246 family)